jgi:hypothetical protein
VPSPGTWITCSRIARAGRSTTSRAWKWTSPERDYPLSLYAGSLYGRQRDWFGLQRVSEIIYDDPILFEEIVETWADVAVAVIEKVCGESRSWSRATGASSTHFTGTIST